MTTLEAQSILDNKIKYKDFTFKVMMNYYDDVFIKCFAPVKDACSDYAYTVSPVIRITTIETIPDSYFEKLNESELIHIAYHMCKRLELHELDEHFKVNNRHYRNPHPEKLNA